MHCYILWLKYDTGYFQQHKASDGLTKFGFSIPSPPMQLHQNDVCFQQNSETSCWQGNALWIGLDYYIVCEYLNHLEVHFEPPFSV